MGEPLKMRGVPFGFPLKPLQKGVPPKKDPPIFTETETHRARSFEASDPSA